MSKVGLPTHRDDTEDTKVLLPCVPSVPVHSAPKEQEMPSMALTPCMPLNTSVTQSLALIPGLFLTLIPSES